MKQSLKNELKVAYLHLKFGAWQQRFTLARPLLGQNEPNFGYPILILHSRSHVTMLPLQFPRMLRNMTQGPQSHYYFDKLQYQLANFGTTEDPRIVRILCSQGFNLHQSYSVTFFEQFSLCNIAQGPQSHYYFVKLLARM